MPTHHDEEAYAILFTLPLGRATMKPTTSPEQPTQAKMKAPSPLCFASHRELWFWEPGLEQCRAGKYRSFRSHQKKVPYSSESQGCGIYCTK